MQCYALQTVLRQMGHEVEVVSIKLPHGKLSWKGKIAISVNEWRNRHFRDKYYSNLTRVYRSAEELRKDPPLADAYIVGSDQVWNPNTTGGFGAEAFFLDFAPHGVRKIAYAASFGTSVWTSAGTEKDAEISRLIKQFDAISVRETNGVDICAQTFGVNNAVSVVDPVFLLEDYSNIIGETEDIKNEVIGYPLCRNATTKDVLMQVSRDLGGGEAVTFDRVYRGKGMHVKMFSSIPEWLRSLAEAGIVVTNSFHCMAFCIILKKRFIITPTDDGTESRMVSVLQQLGISERYVESFEDFQNRKLSLYKDIDYASVTPKLAALRNESLSFLKSNL